MNRSLTLGAMLAATLALTAGNPPAIVAAPVAVPGPTGPAGATGMQRNAGRSGAAGEACTDTRPSSSGRPRPLSPHTDVRRLSI